VCRRLHRPAYVPPAEAASEQDHIAATAGILSVGAVGHWQIAHDIPIEANEQGDVTVSRILGGTGLRARRLSSVDHSEKKGPREFYQRPSVAMTASDGHCGPTGVGARSVMIASRMPYPSSYGTSAGTTLYQWLPLCGDLIAPLLAASDAATANPAVGIAVGVGVQAGMDATISYFLRKRQQAEQDAIATEVATMDDGELRPWKIEHDIPIGNEHGEVQVTRVFSTPLTSCKEIAFSVESGGSPATSQNYTTTACRKRRQMEMGARGTERRALGHASIVRSLPGVHSS
jgi:hypothetical protein